MSKSHDWSIEEITKALKNNSQGILGYVVRWIDQGINSEQSLKIKESILTSARSLKIASEL